MAMQLADYDPRGRDWFRAAVATNTTVWSPPYTFNEGVPGITASRAWRVSDAAAASGVFTVDFYLADLEQLLEEVAPDFDGFFSTILEPDGTMISASKNPDTPALLAALTDWVKKNPLCMDNGADNGHLVSLTVGEDVEYLAALAHVDAPSGLKCIVAGMAPGGRRSLFKGLEKAGRQMIEIGGGARSAVAVVLEDESWRTGSARRCICWAMISQAWGNFRFSSRSGRGGGRWCRR